jgi:hypothetical protein
MNVSEPSLGDVGCGANLYVQSIRSQVCTSGPADGAKFVYENLLENCRVLQRLENRSEETIDETYHTARPIGEFDLQAKTIQRFGGNNSVHGVYSKGAMAFSGW